MTNAVIYARYSSRKQNEQSIEGQLRICRDFAKKENYVIVKEYVDRAASGTNDHRPSFQKMLEDSKNAEFKIVIVYQFDRFARNRRDSLNNKYLLLANGVKVISATEPIPTDDPGSIFIEGMLETVAEYYSRDLSKKTKRGIDESILKRKFIGGYIPLGYSVTPDKKIVINEEEADIVKELFKKYVEGETIPRIVESLNNRGFTKRGKKFGKNSFQHMLSNKKYIGEYEFKGNVIKDMYPQIIDFYTFRRVQDILKSKEHRAKVFRAGDEADSYFLTGKIFCGNCGTRMVGVSGYSRNGKIYRYYKCANKKSCKKLAERKDFIEWYVAEQIVKYLQNSERLSYVVSQIIKSIKSKNKSDNLSKLISRKKKIEKELDIIVSSFSSAEEIIRKELNKKASILDQQLKDCEYEIAKNKVSQSRKVLDPEFVTSFVNTVLRQFKNEGKYYKRIADYFLNSVFLFDDKIVMYLNFDGAQIVNYVDMLKDVDRLQKEKNTPTKKCSSKDAIGDPRESTYEPIWWIRQDVVGFVYHLR